MREVERDARKVRLLEEIKENEMSLYGKQQRKSSEDDGIWRHI